MCWRWSRFDWVTFCLVMQNVHKPERQMLSSVVSILRCLFCWISICKRCLKYLHQSVKQAGSYFVNLFEKAPVKMTSFVLCLPSSLARSVQGSDVHLPTHDQPIFPDRNSGQIFLSTWFFFTQYLARWKAAFQFWGPVFQVYCIVCCVEMQLGWMSLFAKWFLTEKHAKQWSFSTGNSKICTSLCSVLVYLVFA